MINKLQLTIKDYWKRAKPIRQLFRPKIWGLIIKDNWKKAKPIRQLFRPKIWGIMYKERKLLFSYKHTLNEATKNYIKNHSHKKTVVMYLDSLAGGGLERVVIDLCLSLAQRGFKTCIIVANEGINKCKEVKDLDIDVFELQKNTTRLHMLLKRIHPGLVFSHHCYFALDVFKKLNIPIIEVLHNAYYWQIVNELTSEARQHIDKFIAVSSFVKDYSTNFLNIKNSDITCIPNGLNIHGFVRPPLELLYKERMDSLEIPTLIMIANMYHQKNHRAVLYAFRDLVDKFPKARLIYAGILDFNPELFNLFNTEIKTLNLENNVFQVGYLNRKDLSRFLASAHIGLLPTKLEGSSIATFEYSFFGLPSILSNTGSASELKKKFGHVILTENCATPPEKLSEKEIDGTSNEKIPTGWQSIAEAMHTMLNNYESWAKKAIFAGESYNSYSIEHTADLYMHFIKSYISSKSKTSKSNL